MARLGLEKESQGGRWPLYGGDFGAERCRGCRLLAVGEEGPRVLVVADTEKISVAPLQGGHGTSCRALGGVLTPFD